MMLFFSHLNANLPLPAHPSVFGFDYAKDQFNAIRKQASDARAQIDELEAKSLQEAGYALLRMGAIDTIQLRMLLLPDSGRLRLRK